MKLELLDCKIFTFSQEILDRKVLKVVFNTLREGMVEILPRHEEWNFLICPGKMMVEGRDALRTYYHGAGCAKVCAESVVIFAAPIVYESDYDQFVRRLPEIGQAGDDLINIWSKLR